MRTLGNLRFYLFFPVLIRLNEEGKCVQDFLLLPQRFVRLPCLSMIKLMVARFSSIGGRCDSGCEI